MLNVEFDDSEGGVGGFNFGCLQECVRSPTFGENLPNEGAMRVGGTCWSMPFIGPKRSCLSSANPFPSHRCLDPPPPSIPAHTAGMQLPKVSDESCDDDSSCSLSPGPSGNAASPPGLLPLPSLPRVLDGSRGTTPAMVGHRKSGRGVMISEH